MGLVEPIGVQLLITSWVQPRFHRVPSKRLPASSLIAVFRQLSYCSVLSAMKTAKKAVHGARYWSDFFDSSEGDLDAVTLCPSPWRKVMN